MRTTKNQIESAFALFCKVAGFRKATTFNDVGALELDYNPVYGGYVIDRIENDGGAVSCPFTEYRLPAFAFLQALRMMTQSHALNNR